MANETHALMKSEGSIDLVSIEEIKFMRDQVQQLLRDVMKEGIDNDYAIIPGTKKFSLLKPGAEKICSMFRFVVDPVVESIGTDEDVTYRVFVRLAALNGRHLGTGVGECSTKESKFAWREAVCEEEWEMCEPSQRRIHWKRDYKEGVKSVLQVRENPADKSNNVLKIGKKRALVDGVLTVTGCSDIFTQDLEEEEEGSRQGTRQGGGGSQAKRAAPATASGPSISGPQSGRFYSIWKNAGRTPAEVGEYLKKVCKVDDSRVMHPKFYEEACRWAASKEPVPAVTGEKPQAATAQPSGAAPSHEEAQSREAFSILGWDEKTQARFIESYKNDWKVIHSELKILIVKRDEQEKS